MDELVIKQCHCLRCGHEWFPRARGKPKACPRCNSWYWDRPKKQDNAMPEEGKENT